MSNDNIIIPVDHNSDLNMFLSKNHYNGNPEENQFNLFQLTSPYSG